MSKPHKHAELIKAWADGAEIEYWSWIDKRWFPKDDDSRWLNTGEYRIKPKPKPDVVRYAETGTQAIYRVDRKGGDNIKLTFDGETGELKSAEVLTNSKGY